MGKEPLLRSGRGPRELVEAFGLPPTGQQRAVRGGIEGAVRGLPREQHLQRLRGGGQGRGQHQAHPRLHMPTACLRPSLTPAH